MILNTEFYIFKLHSRVEKDGDKAAWGGLLLKSACVGEDAQPLRARSSELSTPCLQALT